MTKLIVNGVILVCLMALLTGCGKRLEVRPVVVTKTVVEKVQAPSQLLEPCDMPDMAPLKTSGDLERVAQDALSAAACGNRDKASLREWQSER
jgi:hypothetical protein